MKRYFFSAFILLVASLFLLQCDETLTGVEDVNELKFVDIQLTSTEYGQSVLVANGTIENKSSRTTISPPFYVEAQFYADDSYNFKLGGDNYRFSFSLAPGEKAAWKISFSSDIVNEGDYPNFAVKNLRAYKN